MVLAVWQPYCNTVISSEASTMPAVFSLASQATTTPVHPTSLVGEADITPAEEFEDEEDEDE